MKSFKPVLLSLCAVGVVSWVGYSFYQPINQSQSACKA